MAFAVSVAPVTTTSLVLATVSDFPAGTSTFEVEAQYRKAAGWGRTYDVLEWSAQIGTGSTFYDAPPYNYIMRYVVTALSTTGSTLGLCTSSEITLYGDTVNIMSITTSSNWNVQVIGDQPSSWEARSAWHTVIGRRRPIAQVAQMLEQAGTIDIRLTGRADFATLREMVDEGWPIRVRSGCERVWTNGVVLPTNITWSPPVEGSTARNASIDYQTILEYAVVRTPTDAAEA